MNRRGVRAARDAGASHAWCRMLDLRAGTREHFLEHLARDWPDQVVRYERLYRDRAYVPPGVQEPARQALRDALTRTPLRTSRRVGASPATMGDPGAGLLDPVQLQLRWDGAGQPSGPR